LFGTNFHIGSHIRDQIKVLSENVPASFRHRELDDLGCGDGKITLMLKEIFQPAKLRAFDINPALVRRARNKGVEAEVKDLDAYIPTGELAVMWGVLHHLKDRETCLKRIQENYRMAFIREPVKNNLRVDWEMGQPLVKEEIERLVQKYFGQARTFYYGNSIFIFYAAAGFQPTTKI
jgi:SAM-dependent methyltransferase